MLSKKDFTEAKAKHSEECLAIGLSIHAEIVAWRFQSGCKGEVSDVIEWVENPFTCKETNNYL